MIDLTKYAGISVQFDPKSLVLSFPDNVKQVRPDVRTLDEMRAVLLNPDVTEPKKLYYMYRDVYEIKDKNEIDTQKLRFDLTVMHGGLLGSEYLKTEGHVHPKVSGQDICYPEVYCVLYGKAHYLLQKMEGETVVDFIVVEAGPGDQVVMLPGYGHVTVNIGKGPLVMANWVSNDFESDYNPVVAHHGFAYYETVDGWVKDKAYKSVPKLRMMKPQPVPVFGLSGKPFYSQAVKDLSYLDYLNNPKEYPDEFDEALK